MKNLDILRFFRRYYFQFFFVLVQNKYCTILTIQYVNGTTNRYGLSKIKILTLVKNNTKFKRAVYRIKYICI